MAINVPADGDDALIGTINTTPLVDVMLVLLIIFLITIPAVTASALVNLPRETVQPDELKADSIILTVDSAGHLELNEQPVDSVQALIPRLRTIAALEPQPEIHILADVSTKFRTVGHVLFLIREAGLGKVNFVTEPTAQARQ